MAKTLIIDGQMWQTNAYFRGMGGYAFGLFSALCAAQPDLQLHIVLNKHMTHDEERLKGIASWLPGAQVHILDLPHEPAPGVEEARAIAALDRLIDETIDAKPGEIYYFIPALFMFQYCAVFPTGVRKLLLFHDLMPLLYRNDLGKYFPAHLYFPRFKTVFEADVVFTNSQTTANDLFIHLGVDPGRVVVIDGSLDERLLHDEQITPNPQQILDRLGIRGSPYVLMPTGGLENKNNVRAAEAFVALRKTLSVEVKLVATSFFDDLAKQELRLIAGEDIIFTDIVAHEELLTLFANCNAVFMPSLYEGLGLPVLEGVAHNKPVACSDVDVFREIPHFKEALYVFDPYNVEDIAEALLWAMAGAGFEQKQQYYPTILKKYSWKRSAALFAEALDREAHFVKRSKPRVRIAVTCPDPRKNNDVALFAQRMYGYGLQHGVEFVYFIDPGGDDEIGATVLPDYVRSLAVCYDIKDVYGQLKQQRFDGVIHFLTSDIRFDLLIRAALSIPGYVYVGNEGYYATIQKLAERTWIGPSQVKVEQQLYETARTAKVFESPSLIASAAGVIVERHVHARVVGALDLAGLKPPVLEVPECSVVNLDGRAQQHQLKVYGQVIDFIVKKVQQ